MLNHIFIHYGIEKNPNLKKLTPKIITWKQH